jgi:hypothetical protein
MPSEQTIIFDAATIDQRCRTLKIRRLACSQQRHASDEDAAIWFRFWCIRERLRVYRKSKRQKQSKNCESHGNLLFCVTRWLTLAFLVLSYSFPAAAQTTLVTGKAIDTNGIPYAGAQISAQLVFAGTPVSSPTVTISVLATCRANGFGSAPCQVPFNPSNGPFQLDPGGNIPGGGITLQDNALVTPSGTQWAFKINSAGNPPPIGTGPQTCTATLTITGASQSVSTSFAACPALAVLASGAGLGSVTTVSAGNLPPLFTSSVATPSTTPAISYSLSNAAANTVFGNCTAGVAPPGFCSLTLAQLPAGSGTVTSFSYAETGIDPLYSATVTNPTTTPQLVETANTVQPGMVLAGPVVTGSATNPTFETSAVNASGVSGTTVSVSGSPAAATTVAIFFGTTGTGQNVPAPSVGTWTAFSGNTLNGSHPLFSNLSSSARLNLSSTIAVSDTWSSSLAFLGGSITAISQSTPSFSTCGTGCGTTTFSGSVTAGHTIVVYGCWASGTAVPTNITATDSLGNSYLLMLTAPNLGSNGHFALVANNTNAGTPTITVHSTLSVNLAGLIAYDLAGPTAYYSGPNGPWQFRNISDIIQASTPPPVSKYFTQNLGADITGIANNSTTTLLTQAVTFPASGCPCRASISYAAAVTSGNSHLFETWISDGTNASGAASQEYVNTGLIYSSAANTIFPNSSAATYANGQAITFTLNLGITTLAAGSVTAKQLSPGGHQGTWMQITIFAAGN